MSFISWQCYRKKFSHKIYIIRAGQTTGKFITQPLPKYFYWPWQTGWKFGILCCQCSYCFPENICICHETFTKLILISDVPLGFVCAAVGKGQSQTSLQGRGVMAENALRFERTGLIVVFIVQSTKLFPLVNWCPSPISAHTGARTQSKI